MDGIQNALPEEEHQLVGVKGLGLMVAKHHKNNTTNNNHCGCNNHSSVCLHIKQLHHASHEWTIITSAGRIPSIYAYPLVQNEPRKNHIRHELYGAKRSQ